MVTSAHSEGAAHTLHERGECVRCVCVCVREREGKRGGGECLCVRDRGVCVSVREKGMCECVCERVCTARTSMVTSAHSEGASHTLHERGVCVREGCVCVCV